LTDILSGARTIQVGFESCESRYKQLCKQYEALWNH